MPTSAKPSQFEQSPAPQTALWLLDDGRAGHTQLSLGLAQLWQRRLQPTATMHRYRWLPPAKIIVSTLRRLRYFEYSFVKLAHHSLPLPPTDLPVDAILFGSGIASLLLGQYWLHTAVPRGQLFWVGDAKRTCLHPHTRILYWHSAALKRFATQTIYSPLLPAPTHMHWPAPHNWPLTLCVGGSTREVPFGTADWATLLDRFALFCQQQGERGQVLLSRRSPIDYLQKLAQPYTHLFKLNLPEQASPPFHFPASPNFNLPLWITADSLSMLNEALWHGWAVQAILPRAGVLPSFHAQMLRYWEQESWIQIIDI